MGETSRKRPLTIVFATAELSPLASTGGLGDVAAALPPALAALGHRVAVFLPLYRSVRERLRALAEVATISDRVYLGERFRIFAAEGIDAPRLYLVEHDVFFDRDGVYGDRYGEFGDNLDRYAFFSRAVVEAMLALELRPDVVHLNDWHTALAAAHLRTHFHDHPLWSAATIVFTIHNLAYQGRFPADRLPVTGLPWDVFRPDLLEFYGGLNVIKAGIVYADAVTTVSPRYAEEIQTPEFGEGLDGLLRARRARLQGILNGVDERRWDPSSDPHIAARYDAANLEGKAHCKQALIEEMGIVASADTPIVGMVTRLTHQKGCDIVLGVADEIIAPPPEVGAALVLLGSGDAWLEAGFRTLAGRCPGRISVRIGFDEALAHRIEAGADLFLMPSRYEPCGLNQMYSLRYGTVPVVRATGGLDDTVQDPPSSGSAGNGFKFRHPRGDALLAALARAVSLYRRPREWKSLMRRGMAEDFSWTRSARGYEELYERCRRPT